MSSLQKILVSHKTQKRGVESDFKRKKDFNTTSEIPDIFFDEILVDFKLSRIEILIFLYLYRKIWISSNLSRDYGVSPLIDTKTLEKLYRLDHKEVLSALQALEKHGLLETIRPNQYFIRRFFTAENDKLCGQSYDDFL